MTRIGCPAALLASIVTTCLACDAPLPTIPPDRAGQTSVSEAATSSVAATTSSLRRTSWPSSSASSRSETTNSPSVSRDAGSSTGSSSSRGSVTSATESSATSMPEPSLDASFDSGACLHADAGATPPSCAPGGPGMTNCGACDESCCTTLLVPGGDYSRTYDLTDGGYPDFPDGGNATGEADPASVSSFRLDKYVVTVGRFRQFVEAWSQGTGYIPAPGSGKHTHLNGGNGLVDSAVMGGYEPGWVASDDTSVSPTSANLDCLRGYSTWTSLVEANENLPINCVEWQEAFAFCIWDGGFLPSEAEWEYAAAGGEEQREYPWGTAAPDNQYAIYGCDFPSGSGLCSGIANLPAVGTARRGAARWGHLDMAGEVYQWTLDWYAAYVDPCVDCAFASDGSNRVIRGGYFAYDGTYLLPSNRGNFPPSRVSGVGFRCARVP